MIDINNEIPHGAEGSDASLAVLKALHKWGPLRHGSLVEATKLEAAIVKTALQGLKTRGRVLPRGHGMGVMWEIAR